VIERARISFSMLHLISARKRNACGREEVVLETKIEARNRRKPDSKSEPVSGVFDYANPVAEVEPLRALLHWPEQNGLNGGVDCCLVDVRLGRGIFAAQQKNGRRGRSPAQDFRIAPGREFEALGQHEMILVQCTMEAQAHKVDSVSFLDPCESWPMTTENWRCGKFLVGKSVRRA